MTVDTKPIAHSADIIASDRIIATTCPECGVTYGIGETFRDRRREDHRTWYCPNGHSVWFPQDNEAERLRKQVATLEMRARLAADSERFYRDQAAAQRRSAAAVRGHLTRLRKRIAAGVCPCCQRSFENVRRHIEGQHPDWASEHHLALDPQEG